MEGDAAAVVLERDLAVRAGRPLVRTAGRFHARQRLIVRFDGRAVVFVSVNRQRARLRIRAVDGGIGPRVNEIIMDIGGQKVIISIGRNRDRFPLRLAPGVVHIC